MSRLKALYDLQQVDSSLDRINSNLASIEVTLADTSALDNTRAELEEAENTLRKARSKQKDLEFEALSSEKHATDLEGKLYGGQIKGVKEMQSAQHEITTFRERRKELEDKVVEAMLEVEEAETVLKTVREKVAQVQAEWEKNTSALRQEQERLQAEIPLQKTEREKALKNVISIDLTVYEKLRAQKQGKAVAEVMQAKICSACRVELPIAKQRELKSPMTITYCPRCGRILYLR
jgi:predicted  nucleic acid-binding Zn-ribbon protein